MPKMKFEQRDNLSYERFGLRRRIREHHDAIVEFQLAILKFYEKDPDYYFYSKVMPNETPDILKKLADLDNLGKEAKKRLDNVSAQLDQFEREEEIWRKEQDRRREAQRQKEEARRRETERKEEARRRAETRRSYEKSAKERKKYAYASLKREMLSAAISLYRENHKWKDPNAVLVEKYKNTVDVTFPKLREHFKKVQFFNQKIASLSKMQLSDSDRTIRLTAIKELLSEENRKHEMVLFQLLSGIQCSDPHCSCRKKILSQGSIPYDYTSNSYDDVLYQKN